MNPSIQLTSEDKNTFKFTLSGINVCFANAIRRTILSDIPTLCIDTTPDNCKIEINNSRLHNEILKERLNAIPVCARDSEKIVEKYFLEVDVKNDTDNMIYITTKDFKIKNKETEKPIDEQMRDKIFPPNDTTGYYIDFARLGCFIDNNIEKEQIKLKANFTVKTASDSGCFSCVSKCTYENTKDKEKIIEIWQNEENELLKKQGVNNISEVNSDEKSSVQDMIEFKKRDFMSLDSQKYFIPNSFDFTIETIGVFGNREISVKACVLLQNEFVDFNIDLEKNRYIIEKSSYMVEHASTIENSYDVILEGKDYTFGNVLQYILYQKFYIENNILTYCGFKKFHPHDSYSVLRIAFVEKVDSEDVKSKLLEASSIANNIFTKIYSQLN